MSQASTVTYELIEVGDSLDAKIGVARAEVLAKATTESQRSVLTRIGEKIEFLGMGVKEDKEAILIARNDDGTNVKAVAIMSVSRQPSGVWLINDLVSVKAGTGTPIVNRALDYMHSNPKGAMPVQTVALLSLDEDSTKFWMKFDFALVNASSDMKANRPMQKKLT